jgi:hypothetical protein
MGVTSTFSDCRGGWLTRKTCGNGRPGPVHGRAKDLVGLYPRGSFNNRRQNSYYLRICFPVIRFRMLGGLPQTEGLNLSSIQVEKSNLVEESPLHPQQGNDFFLDLQLKGQGAVIFQIHIELACKHITHRGFVAEWRIPGAALDSEVWRYLASSHIGLVNYDCQAIIRLA